MLVNQGGEVATRTGLETVRRPPVSFLCPAYVWIINRLRMLAGCRADAKRHLLTRMLANLGAAR